MAANVIVFNVYHYRRIAVAMAADAADGHGNTCC